MSMLIQVSRKLALAQTEDINNLVRILKLQNALLILPKPSWKKSSNNEFYPSFTLLRGFSCLSGGGEEFLKFQDINYILNRERDACARARNALLGSRHWTVWKCRIFASVIHRKGVKRRTSRASSRNVFVCILFLAAATIIARKHRVEGKKRKISRRVRPRVRSRRLIRLILTLLGRRR